MNFYYFAHAVLSILWVGYIFLTPMLLVSLLLFKKHTRQLKQMVTISNGWFLLYGFLFLLIEGYDFLIVWYDQSDYEGYTFYYSRASWFSPYGFSFWLKLFLVPALALLFAFRKIRSNIIFTAFVILLVALVNEKIVIYITGFYRDYLPSSWSSQPLHWWETDLMYFATYLLIVTGTYYFQNKNKPAKVT